MKYQQWKQSLFINTYLLGGPQIYQILEWPVKGSTLIELNLIVA